MSSPAPPPPFPAFPQAAFATSGMGVALGILSGSQLGLLALALLYFCRPYSGARRSGYVAAP